MIWHGLAGFSDLLTVTLLKGAEGGLGKVGTSPTYARLPGSLATFASCRYPKLTCDASVLEETVQEKIIPYLILRSLAGFSNLKTLTF